MKLRNKIFEGKRCIITGATGGLGKQIAKEFAHVLGVDYKTFKVFKIHGWKYSFSNFKSDKECYWDSKLRIGLCGDWFMGPKAESAWLSANNLYKRIKKNPPKFK